MSIPTQRERSDIYYAAFGNHPGMTTHRPFDEGLVAVIDAYLDGLIAEADDGRFDDLQHSNPLGVTDLVTTWLRSHKAVQR